MEGRGWYGGEGLVWRGGAGMEGRGWYKGEGLVWGGIKERGWYGWCGGGELNYNCLNHELYFCHCTHI